MSESLQATDRRERVYSVYHNAKPRGRVVFQRVRKEVDINPEIPTDAHRQILLWSEASSLASKRQEYLRSKIDIEVFMTITSALPVTIYERTTFCLD